MRVKPTANIKSDLQTGFTAAGLTNWNAGSVIGTLKNRIGDALALVYDFGVEAFLNTCLADAEGVFLDAKAADYGVVRLAGAKARRKVTFCRNRAVAATVIPKDTIVQTEVDANGVRYRFYTTAAATLAIGETSVDVTLEAENVGEAYNLAAGTVTKLGSSVTGIDYVSDDLAAAVRVVSEGADAESDARLRYRVYLAWSDLAKGYTADRYESLVMDDVRVAKTMIDRNGPRGEGTITIYVISTTGAPSAALLADLRERIIGLEANDYLDGLRAAGDDIWIQGPLTQTVTVTATIERYSGTSETALAAELAALLAAYFNPNGATLYDWLRPLNVGRAVVFNQIVEIITRPTAVYDVTGLTLNSSGTDYTGNITINDGVLPELGTITFTYREVSV